ncbi:MAG: NAD-dependent succinate-semialdehyde dehydrogenase [Parvularcula sp.]|nr:NAD-dependent succinate-semialdehyde dehydrogenase [Parvularcula sp.]
MSKTQYNDLYLAIGGERRSGGARNSIEIVNPGTEETLGAVPAATKDDLEDALGIAAEAWAGWKSLPAGERGAILVRTAALIRERAEEIALLATLESGKTLAESKIETAMAANTFQWFGEEARRIYGRSIQAHGAGHRMYVRKEPVGPVAAFSPWNFPIANPARKLAPALVAGCTIILKPAEETPASALAVYRCLEDAGAPKGVASIVFGDPELISSVLINSDAIRKISFTGSIPVGRRLGALAAQGGKLSTMELGGHAPVIIAADADMEKAVSLTAASKYRNAGQVCVSPTRFYVERPVYERFVDAFSNYAKGLEVGEGANPESQMGPLIAERRRRAVSEIVADAIESGAEVTAGGSALDRPGYFYRPTVLVNAPHKARVMREEPFGPVAAINPADSLEEAVREANALPYGLAAYGFTQSARNALFLEENLEAGMVGVNTTRISVPESPFGGVKDSGHGSEEGIEGLEAYLTTKFISSTI